MTAFDPSLDQNQPPSGPRDAWVAAQLRHDIERALAAVMSGLGGVAAAGLDARTREQLDRASAAARTLADLVRALAGEEEAASETPIAAVVARARAVHGADARARGLEFVARVAADVPPSVRADAVVLARILDNLLDNALRYAGTGTVTLETARSAAGEIVFRITDEGPGLGAGGEAPGEGGAARGLDIVRALADRIGAAVSLADRPEGGTEAVLRVPPNGPARPAASLAGVRILLAEDNVTNQMVALQMLRSLGAVVTICSDGIEALERFDAEPVDLVIVDIEMPRMSGLDVIREIRARGDERGRVPIVALTAYAMREHRERIGAAGANGLISKPVTSVEALGESLAVHVARRAEPPAPAGGTGADEASEPVIDAATYAALCEAIGPELMAELLDKVISDLLGAQRDLLAGRAPVDRAGIRGASHILISVAGALGALRLQARARALNGSAHTETEEALAPAIAECVAEIDRAVAFARERRGAL